MVKRRFHRVIEVLLVEDNPGDAAVIKEVLRNADLVTRVRHVTDGATALSFMAAPPETDKAQTDQVQRYRPDLLVLDLDLPGADGMDVLSRFAVDARFRPIPIIVLTRRRPIETVRRCYQLGAACFIAKPESFLALGAVLQTTFDFWFNVARIPVN